MSQWESLEDHLQKLIKVVKDLGWSTERCTFGRHRRAHVSDLSGERNSYTVPRAVHTPALPAQPFVLLSGAGNLIKSNKAKL